MAKIRPSDQSTVPILLRVPHQNLYEPASFRSFPSQPGVELPHETQYRLNEPKCTPIRLDGPLESHDLQKLYRRCQKQIKELFDSVLGPNPNEHSVRR